jgi:hypothetical protein
MTETNVFQLFQPGTVAEVLRTGARALLAQALDQPHARCMSKPIGSIGCVGNVFGIIDDGSQVSEGQ